MVGNLIFILIILLLIRASYETINVINSRWVQRCFQSRCKSKTIIYTVLRESVMFFNKINVYGSIFFFQAKNFVGVFRHKKKKRKKENGIELEEVFRNINMT